MILREKNICQNVGGIETGRAVRVRVVYRWRGGQSMRKLLPCICLLASASAWSQENPLSAFTKRIYGFQKDILLRSAEKCLR